MEERLGAILSHRVAVQGHVLDPAALGEQQVCSGRQGVHVGAGGGTNGRRHSTMVHTYRGKRSQLGLAHGPVYPAHLVLISAFFFPLLHEAIVS